MIPGRFPVRFVASLVVTLCASTLAFAQTSAPARFTRLTVEDGLSQSSVQQILQDRRGLMWFGTQEGLSRFDGYRFTVHRARQKDGFLRDHDITALIEGADGDLWVGTSRGLYRHDLDTGRFESCPAPVDRLDILRLVRGGDGRIFFTGSDGKLWTLDPGGADCRPRILDEKSLASLTRITALAPGSGSVLWVAANGALFKVEDVASGGRLTEASAEVGAITVMAADGKGDVWLGGADGVLRYRPSDNSLQPFAQAPRRVLALLPGKGGEIWIGARRGGLNRLNPVSGELLVYRHDPESVASLASDDVPAIYEDANGTLWVGSWNGGVSRFDPLAQAFGTIRHRARAEDSLPANDITVLTETPDGQLWVVSRSGIVGVGDPKSERFRTVGALANRGRVSGLASWDGHVLAGTGRGLAIFDAASAREVFVAALHAHDLGERPIATVVSAGDAAWMASGREVFRATRDTANGRVMVERFDVPVGAPISALSNVVDGRLWIASERGDVVRVEAGSNGAATVLRPLEIADPAARASLIDRGFVTTVHEDRNRRLWLGTRRGLGRVDVSSGAVAWIGEEEGLPSTNVSAIVGDADGRLWVAHNRGVTRVNPATGDMTHFGQADGAQGTGYADGAWAVGESGVIYLAGEGITVFDPRQVAISPNKPRIAFTGLEILHRPVAPRWMDPASPLERAIDAESEITLGPEATVFAVEMAALDYADPSTNRLRYRLEGFDPDWIETAAHNRVVTYTNLAPGRYVLRARAGTRNGVWSEHEATLTIHLLPPWWRTRTALALWGALALVGAALLWSAGRRRAKVKLALLERETLRRESLTDALTGLHNRRFLMSWLDQEVPKLLRDRAELLLVLVDVDHFKSINDRHSHAVGDRVLSRIAGALKEAIRGSDLAVRWGGDEFLVVIRGLQRDLAADSVERLRAAVEAVTAASDPAATVSIGYAPFPFLPAEPDALTWAQTLELADHALHLTKGRQRNSSTGLRAVAGVTSTDIRGFLAGNPRPDGVVVITPSTEHHG